MRHGCAKCYSALFGLLPRRRIKILRSRLSHIDKIFRNSRDCLRNSLSFSKSERKVAAPSCCLIQSLQNLLLMLLKKLRQRCLTYLNLHQ